MFQLREANQSLHLLTLTVVFLALFFRLIWFVDRYAVNVIFWDQWDFLTQLFKGQTTLWQLFSWQHGPPRQGLGGLIQAVVYPLTDWNVRVEAFIAAGFVAVSCVLAMLIKRKLFGLLHWSDIAIPLAFFTLLQFEAFIGTSNLAHGPVPLFLITLSAWVLTLNNQALRAMSLVVLVFLSTYTGFALFAAIPVIIILFIFSWRSKTVKNKWFNIGALILSMASFGSFFFHYQHAPATDCFQFPLEHPLEYVWFSVFQFGSAWGAFIPLNFPFLLQLFKLYAVGLFLILLASIAFSSFLIIKNQEVKSLVIFYLGSFTLLFIVFTSVGRLCLGLEAAFSSRYVSYAIPGILAMYFMILLFGKLVKTRKWLHITILYGVLFLLIIKEANVFFSNGINWYSEGKRNWVNCYLENHCIGGCDKLANFKIYPDSNAIVNKLDYLERNKLSFFKESSK